MALVEVHDPENYLENISRRAKAQWWTKKTKDAIDGEVYGEKEEYDIDKQHLEDTITMPYFKKLETGVTEVDPFYYFMSSRLLMSWWMQTGVGPLASANNDGNRPFHLTQAARVCFNTKDLDDEGRFELKMKKSTSADQDKMYQDVLVNNTQFGTVDDIPIVERFRIVRSLLGGMFVQFFHYMSQTNPFMDYVSDDAQDETTITWEAVRDEYYKWSFSEMGKYNLYTFINYNWLNLCNL